MSEKRVRVSVAPWDAHEKALMRVRLAVFVEEQGVPQELERDDHDARAFHLLAAEPGGEPVGTARLLPDGQIGRMAVLPEWRRRGIGGRLLEELLRVAAARGLSGVFLHAQCTALPFYARFGFQAEGDVFEEAGIPHRKMIRPLEHA